MQRQTYFSPRGVPRARAFCFPAGVMPREHASLCKAVWRGDGCRDIARCIAPSLIETANHPLPSDAPLLRTLFVSQRRGAARLSTEAAQSCAERRRCRRNFTTWQRKNNSTPSRQASLTPPITLPRDAPRLRTVPYTHSTGRSDAAVNKSGR